LLLGRDRTDPLLHPTKLPLSPLSRSSIAASDDADEPFRRRTVDTVPFPRGTEPSPITANDDEETFRRKTGFFVDGVRLQSSSLDDKLRSDAAACTTAFFSSC
jgi:hypothetical protein